MSGLVIGWVVLVIFVFFILGLAWAMGKIYEQHRPLKLPTGNTITPELVRYRCHKIVTAGKILAVTEDGRLSIEDITGAPFTIEAPLGLFSLGRPNVGDYFVVDDNSTQSWSSVEAFEDRYTRISPVFSPK